MADPATTDRHAWKHRHPAQPRTVRPNTKVSGFTEPQYDEDGKFHGYRAARRNAGKLARRAARSAAL